MTTYRAATRTDIPAIISVQKSDGFPHQYYLTSTRLKRLFDRGELFFVAETDGQVIGFGSVDCEIRAQVHFICVHRNFTKQGIGTNLMQLCLKEARRRRCLRASSYVEAHSSKEPFLIRMGFHQVGIYKDRYGNGVDATIWETSL